MWDYFISCWELSMAPMGLGKRTSNNPCSLISGRLCVIAPSRPREIPCLPPSFLCSYLAATQAVSCRCAFPSGTCISTGPLTAMGFPQSDVSSTSPPQRSLPWPPSSTSLLCTWLLLQRAGITSVNSFLSVSSPCTRACLSSLLCCP